ncbi:Kinesin-like protein [Handroanthus impetiginosus]|uniref:Kinesin-like protein n=1 Tax=Handroanthus impetiginosus TaxID=429701 RepID=A0A2G9HVX8_9LAMI|nr:Kinesin-like protein [Handroanthus impetiginosus]
MGSISGESSVEWDSQDSSAHEEKIFVAVRLRPLNERELGKNDFSEWECINNTTIIFKNCLQERSMSPTAYTFDRVFGPDCPTRQVYEEAAKKIAVSVLSGINSSIFTYGQTSSGKTYTMSGITEYAVTDIYGYIERHRERDFVLKFSAMEIYNEVVKDLLSSDGTPLRLLDDPVRGAVVEKLTEVTLRDLSHLKEMLSICQAQRRTGETSLNEMSSRSHQILCLTVESEAHEYFSAENSSILTASVNFVDLAGSERASQTHSAGTRLKEGSHINRSLLTLGTVIRKLSKGRNGHIPYRDSKLTRILQHSLGGNGKTAIICTMSPAHSHVNQKQISTNAQVNIVMSEKALVRQLRKEIARLENELRNVRSLAASCDLASALKEKELIIEKLDEEIRQLTQQRDLSQARIEEMLRSGGAFHTSKSLGDLRNNDKVSWSDGYSPSEASEMTDTLHSDVSSRTSHFSDRCDSISSRIIDHFTENSDDQFLSDNTSPRLYIDKYFGPESPDPGWPKVAHEANNKLEGYCEDVPCIEIDFTKRNTVARASLPHTKDPNSGISPCSSEGEISDPTVTISSSPTAKVANENKNPSQSEADIEEMLSNVEVDTESENLHAYNSHCSITSDFLNEKDEIIKTLIEEIKIKQQEFADDLDKEDEKLSNNQEKTMSVACDKVQNMTRSASDWYTEFERQRKEIIELWDFCNIPLVYRTYFFLLFQGDPSDIVYMEVELRRLSFLKKKIHGIVKDDQVFTHASRSLIFAIIRQRLHDVLVCLSVVFMVQEQEISRECLAKLNHNNL